MVFITRKLGLGVVQAFNTYGPIKLRGKEITNLALLNIFRILSGYRRISHLKSNSDRSVALASGIGMYGSTSKYQTKSEPSTGLFYANLSGHFIAEK